MKVESPLLIHITQPYHMQNPAYDAAYGVYDWQALRQIGTRSNIWWRSTEAVHTKRMGWFPSAAPSEIGSTKKHTRNLRCGP